VTDGALFRDEEIPAGGVGPAEHGLRVAIAAGRRRTDERMLIDQDEALIAAALHAARAMDWTMRTPSPKAIYAISQALTSYRETLHALRLPEAVAAPLAAKVAEAKPKTTAEDWLSDHFGTPEP
jgi:hypothetical protein